MMLFRLGFPSTATLTHVSICDGSVFFRYWVFRSWGRVGTTIGGNKLDKFHDKNSALDNFLSVYKEKTGNDWGTSNFTKYPNKFYPLEIDYGQVQTQDHKPFEHSFRL